MNSWGKLVVIYRTKVVVINRTKGYAKSDG